MKYLYLKILLILCLLNNFTFSQPSITWQRLYDGPAHWNDEGNAICQADNGNFYIAGSTSSYNYIAPYVLKINPYGDTLWSRKLFVNISGDGTAYAITKSTDDGCVITGDSGGKYTIKLDKYGNVIWNKIYGGYTRYFDIRNCWDGGYIACGIGDTAFSLLRIDQNGNKVWKKYNNPTELHSIEVTNDHCFISGSYLHSGLAIKYDSSGSIIWQKQYTINQTNAISFKCIRNSNNLYLLSGSFYDINASGKELACFIRIDSNGNPIYIKYFPSSKDEYLESMRVINNNKYVFSVYHLHSNTSELSYNRFLITDSLGNIIHQKYITGNVFYDYEEINDIQTVSNGDIIFVGNASFYGTSSLQDVYAIRADSLLNFPPYIIGLKRISTSFPAQFALYQNYPNPFNPSTKIKFDIPLSPLSERGVGGFITLKVYDLLGREVAALIPPLWGGQEGLQPGTYEVEWDGTNYPSGVYFYRIQTGNFFYTKKLILLK